MKPIRPTYTPSNKHDAHNIIHSGITPHGYGGRAVFMSDGPMLTGRPVWSPMWFHHEAFHIMEHIFPEAPFSEASQVGKYLDTYMGCTHWREWWGWYMGTHVEGGVGGMDVRVGVVASSCC